MKEVQLQSLGSDLNTALARVAAEERRRAELEAAERARLEAETKKGLHLVTWDLRRASGGQPSGRRRRASRVEPGTYMARLTVDGDVQTASFEVHNDPEQQSTEWIAFEDEEEALEALFEANSAEAERD